MKTHIFTLTLAAMFLWAGMALAQDAVSVDPDREIIVLFKPEVVQTPAGRSAGQLSEFQIASSKLQQTLADAKVEAIVRLMPDFEPEDRTEMSLDAEPVTLADWTNTYVLRLPSAAARDGFITALEALPEVVYAEPNGRGEPDVVTADFASLIPAASASLIPNDTHFGRQWALKNDGTSIQGSGTPDADIDAPEAWEITTGSSSVSIGIVDNGIQSSHSDFAGRVTGDAGQNESHGTGVAGVAAAKGNNSAGIAGLVWNGSVINEDYGNASDADFSAAVRSASSRGAKAINNSWRLTPTGRHSTTLRRAFADVYRQNRVAVASMGNQANTPDPEQQYPAAFGQGVLTVGATTNTDVRAIYSSRGSWIDVVAPGGCGPPTCSGTTREDGIYTTDPVSTYDYTFGTSFAAPAVTGLAALMLAVKPSLYNDDIEQIIRLTAEDRGPVGFDTQYGYGRINARRALDYLRAPYGVAHYATTGGYQPTSTGQYTTTIYDAPGLAPGVYIVERFELRKTVSFPAHQQVSVWGRGAASTGWNTDSPNYAIPWVGVVPGTVTSTSATLRTYIYKVWTVSGNYIGWYPTSASNVVFAYTVHGKPTPVSLPAPTGLNVTGNLGQHPALSWNAVSGATGYKVYRCTSSTTSCSNFAYVTTTSSTSYTDLNRTVGSSCSSTGSEQFTYYHVKAYNSSGDSPASAAKSTCTRANKQDAADLVAGAQALLPSAYALEPNYPNPFNPTTEIRFALPEAANVRLVVYDALGREVARLVDGPVAAGYQHATFEAANLPSGVYLYRLEAKGAAEAFSKTGRMVLVK